MSKFTIDEILRSAAGDGGAVATWSNAIPRVDFDELFLAWSIERGQNIESQFLLSLSRVAIDRLLQCDPEPSTTDLGETRALIQQIDTWLKKSLRNQA